MTITSPAATTVWSAYVDPYGNATNIGTPTTTLDMRLRGQSLQAEADGLAQNRWRDYDASLGRYVEADPLGIAPGANLYSYVEGNPLNFSDPAGLCPPQSGNGCKAPPISQADRDASRRGDRSAFWNSRAAEGDPLAATALGIVNNDTLEGQLANNRLQDDIVTYFPRMQSMDVANKMQGIGVALMRAHVAAIDRFGSPNLDQITDYHRDVFRRNGLPGSTFGGTAIGGSAILTNLVTKWAGCR